MNDKGQRGGPNHNYIENPLSVDDPDIPMKTSEIIRLHRKARPA